MRILGLVAALTLLVASTGSVLACAYQTAKSNDVYAATGTAKGNPQSTPDASGAPRG